MSKRKSKFQYIDDHTLKLIRNTQRKKQRIGEQSGFHYGNWCGPGWTAGQKKDAVELASADKSIPAVNALDAVCKDHDIAITEAESFQDLQIADNVFVREAKKQGVTGKLFSALVGNFGPAQQANPFVTPDKAKRLASPRMTDPRERKRLNWKDNIINEMEVDPAGRVSLPNSQSTTQSIFTAVGE